MKGSPTVEQERQLVKQVRQLRREKDQVPDENDLRLAQQERQLTH
jgi:hypothetical protein